MTVRINRQEKPMYKYGLKLWSTNSQYIPDAITLFQSNVFQYLELFAVPGTYSGIMAWRELRAVTNIPVVIHAPHYMAGMNLSDPERAESNRRLAEETFRFADALASERMIFHPGVNGREEESARQLKSLYDRRLVVENKPYLGVIGGLICVGYSPSGIKSIMDYAGIGFCLDIGHAIAAANALKREARGFLEEFIRLRPAMYHLADGNKAEPMDRHLHLGEGDYDFHYIMSLIPAGEMVTLETEKKYPDNLGDCESDVRFLNSLRV